MAIISEAPSPQSVLAAGVHLLVEFADCIPLRSRGTPLVAPEVPRHLPDLPGRNSAEGFVQLARKLLVRVPATLGLFAQFLVEDFTLQRRGWLSAWGIAAAAWSTKLG